MPITAGSTHELPSTKPRSGLQCCGLERESRNELVIYDDNTVILDTRLEDQIRNGSSIGEGRDVTSNLVEGESEVLREARVSWALDLSPMIIIGDSGSASLIAARVALLTDE
jgi:hypothetical protein